jgi:hypothetical protein
MPLCFSSPRSGVWGAKTALLGRLQITTVPVGF